MLWATPLRSLRPMLSAADFYQAATEALAKRNVLLALEQFNAADTAGYSVDSCAAGRWESFMLLGEFENAWRESDAIAARGTPDPNGLWDGQRLAGKRVIVRCLHGLGDAVQFLRYMPLLSCEARFVTVEAPRRLMPLVETIAGVDATVSWEDPKQQYPPWDAQVETMELPRIFRTQLSTIPAATPYVLAGSAPASTYGRRHRPRVGLIWAASEWDRTRNIAFDDFIPLLDVPNVEFCALQAGYGRDEFVERSGALALIDLTGEREDLLQTAQALSSFDLLITVDTMMAHLAGALAVPVWLLLGPAANWRWMLDRQDSPWYPSMRLFRKSAAEDWSSVITRLRTELLELTDAGSSKCL